MAENQNVITFGELGDKFYIILSGVVSVLVPDKIRIMEKVDEEGKFRGF